MRIAVTSSGPTLDAEVDPRFGRCPYLLIVETDTMQAEAIENDNAALSQGAGIQSAQFLATKGVASVLTGNCGPNAHATLTAAGIAVVSGCSGPVRDVIERFNAGQLEIATQPNVASHAGAAGTPAYSQEQPMPSPQQPGGGGGRGMGRGCGGGKGMGRGRGRGMGRGCGGGGQGRGRGGGGR
jgi:predicted Fe-Mo cluster-binding NifX family protein